MRSHLAAALLLVSSLMLLACASGPDGNGSGSGSDHPAIQAADALALAVYEDRHADVLALLTPSARAELVVGMSVAYEFLATQARANMPLESDDSEDDQRLRDLYETTLAQWPTIRERYALDAISWAGTIAGATTDEGRLAAFRTIYETLADPVALYADLEGLADQLAVPDAGPAGSPSPLGHLVGDTKLAEDQGAAADVANAAMVAVTDRAGRTQIYRFVAGETPADPWQLAGFPSRFARE